MNILGLNYAFHDSTACILQDGALVVAIEEERLSRHKHTYAFPRLSSDRCLKDTRLTYSDIDHIAVSIKPTLHLGKKLLYGIKLLPKIKPFISQELLRLYNNQKNFWAWYNSHWPESSTHRPTVHFVPHHMSHMAGTFYASPYESAALLSLDGSGEWSTSFLGHGTGTEISIISESFFPMSLGSFYEAATQFCGFRPNYDEGKTMGLAPMGDPTIYHDLVDRMVTIEDTGNIHIDLSYFNYQRLTHERCSDKFYATFGQPRHKGGEFHDNHLNVAAAFQRVLEEKVLRICDILHEKTKEKYLVIAGGVSLNSVMNGRILRESKFEDLYVMPAAGDNGTAIGAAYYAYNHILKQPRHTVHDSPYLGTEYSNNDIEKVLSECKLKAEYHDDICAATAEILQRGEIIGWFQGRMEIGPRALGNRSILANPAYANMKDKINLEVKHREAYRPFAPSAPLEHVKDYFEMDKEDPFMLKVCYVRPDKRDIIPAIVHVDGSARLQTVKEDINPRYHELLTKFGQLSGVPVLLNTSFNIMGEPIVESPMDAIRCFFSTGLDKLVLGNYLITK
ncbi:MAG: carbamoyltransferase C-terminal domain-containing protein [Gammaproteobacteria bacterium]